MRHLHGKASLISVYMTLWKGDKASALGSYIQTSHTERLRISGIERLNGSLNKLSAKIHRKCS